MNNQQEIKMKFEWRVEPEKILDAVEQQRFERVIGLLNIKSGYVIDSYAMAAGGPVLTSLFIIGGGFVVEVRLSDPNLNFDVVQAKKIINYQVKYSEHIQNADPNATAAENNNIIANSVKTEFGQITVLHSENLRSSLTYFGHGLDEWVAFCIKAYPPSSLIG